VVKSFKLQTIELGEYMKKMILITSLVVSLNSYSVDFADYIKNMKTQALKLLNSGEETDDPGMKWVLPSIPKVAQNATSTDVYNKTGRIYEQGMSFKKLSNEDKRKYRIAFIQEVYSVTKNADVGKTEILKNLNMLEQGGSREGIYRSIVLGQDYFMLESYEEKSSDKLGVFVIDYGKKYLGRKFSLEQIKRINLWGVKRIIVEKTLEIVDSFNKDGKDLSLWYAILSAELAENNKMAFTTKTRLNSSVEFHKKWAQSVPYQQIKSEVIVKLHKAMNSLQ
jgi:hypothetical protein